MGPEFGHLLDSLGWAIVHSLWQGTLAVLCVIAFRNLTKESQAAARYGFQVVAMTACLAAFIITFGIYQLKTHDTAVHNISPLLTLTTFITETRAAIPATPDMSLSRLLTLSAPVLGILWCLGFAVLAARYLCAFIMTQQLRTQGTTPVPHSWENRFQTLVLNSGIRRHVDILISSRVTGPLTLGFFKPIVLVPASFFTGLPCEQAEAILLHEIAHIRRHDYLVNLLQTVIKTVFFFHPAVQYISRKIDHDREHACDDFAVALTRDPQSLARGLAALRLDIPANRFALAADNGNTPLVARLKRLGNISETRRRPEHVMASVATLILATGLYITVSPLADAQLTETSEDPASHPSGKQGNYQFVEVRENNRTFTAKIAADDTRWINVDGRWYDIDENPEMIAQLPDMPTPPTPPSAPDFRSTPDQYQIDKDYYVASLQYTSNETPDDERLRDRIQREIEQDMEKSQREMERALERADAERERALDRAAEQREREWQRMDAQREEALERAEEQREAEMERAEALREREWERAEDEREAAMERAEAQREREWERAEAQREAAMDRAEEQRERAQEQQERAQEQRERAMEQAERQRERSQREAEKMRRKHAKTYKSFSKAMMSQLKADGLVDGGADSVTITYPNKKMTVNGKAVPRSLEDNYCELLDKYDVEKNENTRIKIRPASFEYKSESNDGKSSHHVHEEFDGYDKDARVLPAAPIQPTRWTQGVQAVPISFTQSSIPKITYPETTFGDTFFSDASFSHPVPESWIRKSYTRTISGEKHHTGVDLAAARKTTVQASAPGVVTYAKPAGKWGNMIKITHEGGYETRYAHVGEICVAEGDKVSRGYNIATVGSTGTSSVPHLHFEIHLDGEAQDPKDLIQGF